MASFEALNETQAQLELGKNVPVAATLTLRQSGVEVAVTGNDVDLVEATFDALYEKYHNMEGYKGAAPTAVKSAEPKVMTTRDRIARAQAIRAAQAARGA